MTNLQQMNAVMDKIRQYDKILIFRHVRLDGDCVGSSKGLQRLLQLTWPQKDVRLVDYQKSDYLAFLGADEDEADDDFYREALAVVVDTACTDRISNQKFKLCRESVKIDHHINNEPYGDAMWVEEERSSCCEMIARLYEAFQDELVIDRDAATYIYTGMVTDSGRFRFEGVCGDTMRLAGLMLDQGVKTEPLFANLYLSDFATLKFKAAVYEQMQITENGVAHVFISREMQKEFGITLETASTAVSFLEGIKGCLSWIAFIESGDAEGSIRVRLRSRFMAINTVAEKYRGGGHACASGATVYNQQEMAALIADADAAVKEYKESHEGWL